MSKTTKVIIIGLIAMFLGLGYFLRGTAPDRTRASVASFSSEVEVNLVKIMQNACEASYGVKSGMLETECGRLIDSLQCRGFEVFSKNGEFWAEPNKEMRC